MCYFITMAVPCSSTDRVLSLSEPGLSLQKTRNLSARAAAGNGKDAILVTGGGCSCAWYREPRSLKRQQNSISLREKYSKKGWSQSRIERVLAQQTATKTDPGDGLHGVIVDLVEEAISYCEELILWIRFFNGEVESETYQILSHERYSLADFKQIADRIMPSVAYKIVQN